MKYMIHSCDKRLWYVNEFLVPSMLEQGIPEHDIDVVNDDNHRGCLMAYVECFRKFKRTDEGTWHLQDDVLISRDFAKKTAERDEGIVYGFFHKHLNDVVLAEGMVSTKIAGYSFPCIRIPDRIAAEFADWVMIDAQYREQYQHWVKEKKYVDAFWRDFVREKYPDDFVYRFRPSIVEHVDMMIGGSIINFWRDGWCRADEFNDHDLVEELAVKLAGRK